MIFIIGLFVGTLLGVALMAMMQMAGRDGDGQC